MKKGLLTYLLLSILLLDMFFIIWKIEPIYNKFLELPFLKDAFINSTSQAFSFYGPSIFSLLIISVNSIILPIGIIKGIVSKKANRLIQLHVTINFLILIFCFPLTLIIKEHQFNGLIGIRIFNSFSYAFIIISQVIIYAIIKNKEKLQTDKDQASILNRLINLIIDTSVILVIILLIRDILFFNYDRMKINSSLLTILVIFTYYFLTELIFKQTIGKTLTNTQISKPENLIKQLFIRTLCRLIPFYQLSPLIGEKKPWHDKFSNTTVLKILPTTSSK